MAVLRNGQAVVCSTSVNYIHFLNKIHSSMLHNHFSKLLNCNQASPLASFWKYISEIKRHASSLLSSFSLSDVTPRWLQINSSSLLGSLWSRPITHLSLNWHKAKVYVVKFRAHSSAGTSSGSLKTFPFEDPGLSCSLLKNCMMDALPLAF